MIKVGNKEVEGRYITDGNGIPYEVVATYVGDNLVYNAKIEEANAEFYYRKTGGTQSVGSGIAAIKEVRGKSIVWNQQTEANETRTDDFVDYGFTASSVNTGMIAFSGTANRTNYLTPRFRKRIDTVSGHIYYVKCTKNNSVPFFVDGFRNIWSDNGKPFVRLANKNITPTPALSIIQDTSYDDVFEFMLIDLTLMFGAGNEPATVAEFEKMFPLDYYDYNAGEIIPFAGQNLVTIGKNQYNSATGKANLLGGQTYQLLGTYTGATIDEVAVTLDSNNCFTTTKDCVLEITGGNNEDTFVGLYNGETNTYEPYEKHTLPLDPSQWRDKQGNLVFPYGGMHGVGTAYDYAKVDADGYIRKAVKVFEQVDLGSLTYVYSNTVFVTQSIIIGDRDNKKNICELYTNSGYVAIPDGMKNMEYQALNDGIAFMNSKYTDATTFKNAMQGVMLYYELATPVEVELATPVYAKYLVDKDGTEEITPANGATPYTTMANLHLVYRKK